MDTEDRCCFCNSVGGDCAQLPCGDQLCGSCILVFSSSGEGSFDCPVCGAKMEQDRIYEPPPPLRNFASSYDDDSVKGDHFGKSATLPLQKGKDDHNYATMGQIERGSSVKLMKSPIPGSPTRERAELSFFPKNFKLDDQRVAADEGDSSGPPGPRLPPRITPPKLPPPLPTRRSEPSQRNQSDFLNKNDTLNGVFTSSQGPNAYIPSGRPTLNLDWTSKSERSTSGPKVKSEYARYAVLGDDLSTERQSTHHLVADIGEKYQFVERSVTKCHTYIETVSVSTEKLKDSITESTEESLKNIDWIERTLLKEIRIRSEVEDHGAEIIHNAMQTFYSLEKRVNEICESKLSDHELIDKALKTSAQLQKLLQREIVSWENKEVLFIENYCDLSVGTLVNKMTTRCVGIVGISDRLAIVVTDHRESLGMCFGLWSKPVNRCIKWEVAFQPKDTESQVVLSPTLGDDGGSNSVIAVGIGETLHLVQTGKVFDKAFDLVRNVERSIKLKLGFNMSSIVFVEDQPTLVCIACNKQNSVTIFDCKNSDEQILPLINVIGGELFHLSFATMLQGQLQLGVLLKTGKHRESMLSLINQDGIIQRTMTKIAVKQQKVIPFAMSLSNRQMNFEISVLFFNQLASCQFHIGKFDYCDLTPTFESVKMVSTKGRIPVNMTTLPGTNTTVMVFTNSETLLV